MKKDSRAKHLASEKHARSYLAESAVVLALGFSLFGTAGIAMAQEASDQPPATTQGEGSGSNEANAASIVDTQAGGSVSSTTQTGSKTEEGSSATTTDSEKLAEGSEPSKTTVALEKLAQTQEALKTAQEDLKKAQDSSLPQLIANKAAIEADIANLDKEIAVVNESLKQAGVSDQMNAVTSAEATLAEKQDALNAKIKERDALNDEIAALQESEEADAADKLIEANKKKKALTAEIDTLEAEVTAAQTALNDAKEALATSGGTAEEPSAKDKLLEKLNSLNERKLDKEKSLAEASAAITDSLGATNKAFEQLAKSLEAAQGALTEAVTALKSEDKKPAEGSSSTETGKDDQGQKPAETDKDKDKKPAEGNKPAKPSKPNTSDSKPNTSDTLKPTVSDSSEEPKQDTPQTEDPVMGGASGSQKADDAKGTQVQKVQKAGVLPQTSDASLNAALAVFGLAGAGVVMSNRRRKRDEA